jgi:hypothetical protein
MRDFLYMNTETITHINVEEPLNQLRDIHAHAVKLPQEAHEFKSYLRKLYLGPTSNFSELYGGHRNLILLENNTPNIQIVWRSHETRWPIIIRSVLTEHIVSSNHAIPGRQLQNPLLPIEINEHGHVITKLRYVPGEQRYPWNVDEIQSAAFLLKKLHTALRHVTFDSHQRTIIQEGDHQWIHGDYGRANTLFTINSRNAESVIDYENLQFSTREQDIGRTMSLLLVDTQLSSSTGDSYVPYAESQELMHEFMERTAALVDTYPTDTEIDYRSIFSYARAYLTTEDYGTLNHMAIFARDFVDEKLK